LERREGEPLVLGRVLWLGLAERERERERGWDGGCSVSLLGLGKRGKVSIYTSGG